MDFALSDIELDCFWTHKVAKVKLYSRVWRKSVLLLLFSRLNRFCWVNFLILCLPFINGLLFILRLNVNKLLSKHLSLFDVNLLYVFESLQLVLLKKIAHTIFDGDDPSQKHFDVQLVKDFFFEVLQHFHLLPIFFKLENLQNFVDRKC